MVITTLRSQNFSLSGFPLLLETSIGVCQWNEVILCDIYVPELTYSIMWISILTLSWHWVRFMTMSLCPLVNLNRGIVPLLEKGEAWQDMGGTVILTMGRDSEESSICKDEAIACCQKPHILTNTHRWNLEHVSGVVLIPWALFVHFITDDRKAHYLIIEKLTI